MKVYVDFEELDVEDRPTYICNKYNLQVKSINSGTRYDNVKLVSLADYTKQVRKEVVQEIIELAIKRNNDQFYIMVTEILDQIQGENNG
jgi:hypothetical protein